MAGSSRRFLIGIAFLLGLTTLRTGWGGTASTHSIEVGGVPRTFHVYVPPGLRGQPSIPLVIALHGGGTNGQSMERFSGLSQTAERWGFAVAYPDGTGRANRFLTWNAGACCGRALTENVDDVAFLRRLVDWATGTLHVDPDRVYVTGISNGAMMAYRLAAETPKLIAAVAAVAGGLEIDPGRIRAPVPVLHFHGTEDAYVPFQGGRGPRTAPAYSHASVSATIQAWVQANGAELTPAVTHLPDRKADGTRVVRSAYRRGTDPDAVVLYTIIGGGHTWPGRPTGERILGRSTRDIAANEIIWQFFLAHPQGRFGRPMSHTSPQSR
ncbi:MAG: prolyl oligopeptidase family serine peptidase [candidate division NC10 bacterium]|nr:prolyl oligopeptidase family serine peptidase [candidate division NC10 bacterium]